MSEERYTLPVASGIATLAAIGLLLFGDVDSVLLLFVAAVGAPITVMLLVRAVAAPEGGRALLPSLAIGATLVPFLVVMLSSAFFALSYWLVEPFARLTGELFDDLRADPELLEILTSPWAFIFIFELAIVAPLAEETLKPLGSLLRRPTTARDAFLFGVAAGAGFAAIENILYASAWFWSFDEWLAISLVRLPGAALHPLCAGLVSLGWYQLRHADGGGRQLAGRYAAAFAIHGGWNGIVAATIVLFGERARIGAGLEGSALAWGIALTVALGAYGMLLLAALITLARTLRTEAAPTRLFGSVDFTRPETVGAWALLGSALILPASILILVFPDFLAL